MREPVVRLLASALVVAFCVALASGALSRTAVAQSKGGRQLSSVRDLAVALQNESVGGPFTSV